MNSLNVEAAAMTLDRRSLGLQAVLQRGVHQALLKWPDAWPLLPRLAGIPLPAAVGIFSGATTNTPSLAAAGQALRQMPAAKPRNSEHFTRAITSVPRQPVPSHPPPGAQDGLWGVDGWQR